MRGGLCGSAGEAVARGASERRLVAVSAERFGEDAAESLIERDALDGGTNAGELRGVGGDQLRRLRRNWVKRGLAELCSWNGL